MEITFADIGRRVVGFFSTTPGEILDNDNVMNTLETLKSETDGLNEKLAHSGEVMNRVEEIRSNYSDVAKNLSEYIPF